MTRWMAMLACLGGLLAGCATVRPWQRGRLASPCMAVDPPAASGLFQEHVRAVRTGDMHAGAAGGGGCGCN